MTAPLGLRLLCRATGVPSTDADITAAHAVAQRLAEQLNHDCNPTYCAITDLARTIAPEHERHEAELLDAIRAGLTEADEHQDDEDQLYGRVAITVQHASFLLGAAYAFVVMSALGSPERSGDAR